MLNILNKFEREHLTVVKSLSCSVCGAAGPSEAHHIEQGLQFCCVALCADCHRGGTMGWHGQKRAWKVRKMSEIDALNVTIKNYLKEILK